MGIGTFFRNLFGTSTDTNEPPPIEAAPDAVKDASDYYAPQPEILSETSEPITTNSSMFEGDGEDDLEDIRKTDAQSENRMEEPAD